MVFNRLLRHRCTVNTGMAVAAVDCPERRGIRWHEPKHVVGARRRIFACGNELMFEWLCTLARRRRRHTLVCQTFLDSCRIQ